MIKHNSDSQKRVDSGFVLRKEPKVASFSDGFKWFFDGAALFGKNPMGWILQFLTWSVLNLISAILFQELSKFLWPIFIAGFMWGSYALDTKNIFPVNSVFSGFTHKTKELLLLGLYYVVAFMVVFYISRLLTEFFIGDLSILDDQQKMISMYAGDVRPEQLEELINTMRSLLFFSLLLLFFTMPIFMAIWFSPALVIINGVPPIEAIKLSFIACLRNMLSLLSYGIVSSIAIFIAAIPLGLGLFIVIPILFASIYISYKDIFIDESGADSGSDEQQKKHKATSKKTSIEL